MSKPTDRGLALCALALLGVAAAVDVPGTRVPLCVVTLVALALVVFARVRAHEEARPVAELVLFVCAGMVVLPIWQLSMLFALIAYRATVGTSGVWPRGRVPAVETALVGGVTPFALTAWLVLLKPDISNILGSSLLDVPFAVLVVGAVVFAVLNATLEELIFRGVLQHALTPLFGVRVAVFVQAVSFGAQHVHGFPRGMVGMLLAGTWGLMLGALRLRSGGMLAPILAHVIADATIALLVITRL